MTMKSRIRKNVPDLKLNKNMLLAQFIKEELDKLFRLKPDYDAEMDMLHYQYDHEEEERLGLHASSVTAKDFCYKEQLLNVLYKTYKDRGKVPRSIDRAFHQQLHGGEENIPIGLKRIFEEGKSIGTKWQRLFIRGGLANKKDLDVSRWVDEYDLSYTPDGIITLQGKKYVVEIKSMNTFGWQKARSHPSGQRQLKLYMYFEGIDRGFVLCDNKNTSDYKIFLETNVNESDPDIATVLERLEKVQRLKKKALQTHRMPHCKCKKCTSPKK